MSVSNLLKFILILLAVLSTCSVIGQELPPIQNYHAVDYNGENQNWAISQSSEKLIYVANSGGLLEFNGADWKLYPSPNESIMRSVQVIDDRIYTGCYMEFGYWQKDESGTLNYTSISNQIDVDLIEDEEFWNIIDMEDWIVFQSLNRIYIYNVNDASVNTIDSNSTITKMYKIDQSIYFQRIGKGIFRIDQGKDILVTDEEEVRSNDVINIFQFGKEKLVLTRDNGFYSLRDSSLVKSNFASNDLLSKVSVYDGIRLRDKSFVLGTIAKGLIHLSEQGELLSQIDQDRGLSNNTVLALFEDVENNIWLGLDNGISYINASSPYRVFHDNKGKLGSIYASEFSNGNLYLGTNQGLFYKRINSNDDFSFIEGTQGQVWTLREINGTLFCGHNTGTFIIDSNRARKISNILGTWHIAKLDHKDNFLLQGNYDGLYVLEKANNTWKLRNKIAGFNNSSRYVETHGDEIYVNHEYKGIFRLKVDSSFTTVKEMSIDTLLKGSNSGIIKYNGDLLYAYKKGVFKYDDLSQRFIRDSLISRSYTEDEYESGKLIVDKKDNKLWIFTKSNIAYITPAGLSNAPKIKNIPFSKTKREGIQGYENITKLEDTDKFLIGTTSGYITVDINELKTKDFQVQIGSVRNGDIKPIKGSQDKKLEYNFKNNENNLEISFFTPEYNKYLTTSYQVQLLGIYDDWSSWSEESIASFENLPFGSYTFNVRAKIGNTISNNIATYSFKIARPWFISNMMVVIYLIGMILLSFLTHNMYKRYYRKLNQELIIRNNRKLELIKVQNEKEIIKIKNDQLRADIRDKSKELAVSTMIIIKKNELLTDIKYKLNSLKGENLVKSIVIQIIDKSLKKNDDWEFFQEAFNNADREFFNNLKTLHPTLSPNDLKLCAYLRLNLSTKEMAKLLNITSRSVEIKRYRLRKKLNLQHEENLVNYIIDI